MLQTLLGQKKYEEAMSDEDPHHLKKSDTWKIQLIIAINFVSSKDTDEEREIHSKSDYIDIMICDKADEVIKVLSESS